MLRRRAGPLVKPRDPFFAAVVEYSRQIVEHMEAVGVKHIVDFVPAPVEAVAPVFGYEIVAALAHFAQALQKLFVGVAARLSETGVETDRHPEFAAETETADFVDGDHIGFRLGRGDRLDIDRTHAETLSGGSVHERNAQSSLPGMAEAPEIDGDDALDVLHRLFRDRLA